MTFRLPSPESALELHQRLLRKDVLAPQAACLAFLPALTVYLQHKFPSADPHLHATAAADALLDYLHQPQRFDPCRGNLFNYLCVIAQRDFQNHQRNARRHDHVELPEQLGNSSQSTVLDALLAAEQHEQSQRQLSQLAQRLPQRDQRVLRLMLQAERSTSVYARVMQLDHLPHKQQQQEVKRAKDRIFKRLLRGVLHV